MPTTPQSYSEWGALLGILNMLVFIPLYFIGQWVRKMMKTVEDMPGKMLTAKTEAIDASKVMHAEAMIQIASVQRDTTKLKIRQLSSRTLLEEVNRVQHEQKEDFKEHTNKRHVRFETMEQIRHSLQTLVGRPLPVSEFNPPDEENE